MVIKSKAFAFDLITKDKNIGFYNKLLLIITLLLMILKQVIIKYDSVIKDSKTSYY